MAVVKEYTTSAGVHITFMDDEYRDKTEEEKEALRKNIDHTISKLILDMAYGERVV